MNYQSPLFLAGRAVAGILHPEVDELYLKDRHIHIVGADGDPVESVMTTNAGAMSIISHGPAAKTLSPLNKVQSWWVARLLLEKCDVATGGQTWIAPKPEHQASLRLVGLLLNSMWFPPFYDLFLKHDALRINPHEVRDSLQPIIQQFKLIADVQELWTTDASCHALLSLAVLQTVPELRGVSHETVSG